MPDAHTVALHVPLSSSARHGVEQLGHTLVRAHDNGRATTTMVTHQFTGALDRRPIR
jgi:hypothetical protein